MTKVATWSDRPVLISQTVMLDAPQGTETRRQSVRLFDSSAVEPGHPALRVVERREFVRLGVTPSGLGHEAGRGDVVRRSREPCIRDVRPKRCDGAPKRG